ncbi:MAG: GDP-L-fucose synthase family protein [Chlamydiales bacterium]
MRRKLLIAGARGMVGSAIARFANWDLLTPAHEEVDFCEQSQTRAFLRRTRPDAIVIAAAKVGGIYANMTYPAEFLYDNLMIAAHLIHEAHKADINRLLFLGSTCIYPKLAEQPIKEEALLSGPLEETNEAYALAKISGVKLCQFYRNQYGRDYISAMPTNLYGPGDNYHSENSHVIPALIRRFHEGLGQEEVTLWGTGLVRREFLFVDDLAKACLFLLDSYHDSLHINVGSDEEFTIREVAEMVANTVGFTGVIVNDFSKPDGTPRKKSDCTRIHDLGWRATISLKEGLKIAYADFQRQLTLI